MSKPKKLAIPEAVRFRAQKYITALRLAQESQTEDFAAWMRRSAERHRTELGHWLACMIAKPETLHDVAVLLQQATEDLGLDMEIRVAVESRKETP